MQTLLLQAGNEGMINLVFMAAIMLVAYFFLIRPQAKRAREQRGFAEELEKGMDIVTAGGIHGKISKIDGDEVTIEVYNKTYLKVEKNTINMEMTKAAADRETANSAS